jgi:hypothetical protein
MPRMLRLQSLHRKMFKLCLGRSWISVPKLNLREENINKVPLNKVRS